MTRIPQLKWLLSGASLAALAACSTGVIETDGPRALEGDAPAGSSDVYAIDAEGNVYAGALDADHFRIPIDSLNPVHVLVADADGNLRVVSFPSGASGERQTAIPAHTGTVNMQALTACDCDGNGADDELDPEVNPLSGIDSDDDGASDLDDDDDDNDGADDDSDSDDDGNGTADDEEDLDADSDGQIDEIDTDDDGDGEPDDEEADSADDAEDSDPPA